jgi:TonB family protein
MLDFHRLALIGLAMSLHGTAIGQAASPMKIDESKLPEWIKRQAASPYKVIIESTPQRAKPSAKTDAPPAKTAKAAAVKPSTPEAASVAAAPKPAASTAASAEPRRAAVEAAPASVAALPSPPPAETAGRDAPATSADVPAASGSSPLASAAMAVPTAPEPVAEALEELKLLTRVDPQLTPKLLAGMKGSAKVMVTFTVNRDGSIAGAAVTSSTHAALNRVTLEAVKEWRFAPIAAPREHTVAFTFVND